MRRRSHLKPSHAIFAPLAISLVLIAGCVPASASQGEAEVAHKAGDIVVEPFEFETNDGQKVEAERGRLYVPERHDDEKGKLIELAFVRFKSTAETPSAPIVYLAGGPGGSGISAARGSRFPLFMAMREIGDVIALDQRGTGASVPSLACSSSIDLPLDKPATPESMLEAIRAASTQCAEALKGQGIDVAAYNTVESVEDLETLREALGAKKISLWAISYGTHLAMAAMRRNGKHIERAILAGVEGPDHTLKLPSNVQAELERISELVEKDEALHRMVPDLLAMMKAVLDRLEKQPVTVQFTDPDTKERVSVTVGKFDLQLATSSILGDKESIAQLPLAYYAMSKGDFTQLGYRAMQMRRGSIGSAMSYAMDCASGATSSRTGRIARETKESLLGDAINFPFPDVCDAWAVPDLGNSFRSTLRTKVPVLVLSGTLDGRTPVANGEEVMGGLSRGTHVIIQGAAHSDDLFLSSPRILEVMLEFMKEQPVSTTTIELSPVVLAK